MRRQYIFHSNGWDSLEVRIAPSAVGLAPAAEIARIDAHVQHAKVHRYPEVHHEVHDSLRKAHHVSRPIGGTVGGGTAVGGGTIGGGYY